MMRTSVLIGARPPTVVYSPCCNTRNSLGLRLQRHVADLVQEQSAAFGLLEASDAPVGRARERAALVTEQLAFHQLLGNRGHVDGDESAVPALAVIVQRARHQLLAGAAFAHDHHGEVGLSEARDDAIDFLHRRRTADQRQPVFGSVDRAVALCLRALQCPRHHAGQFLQVEGLGQIFERAAFGRGDRGQKRILRAHHQDGQIGTHALDARNKIEAAFIRQHHVGDDQIALARRNPAPQAGRRAGRAHVATGAPQRLVQHRANGAVVVADQELSQPSGLSRLRHAAAIRGKRCAPAQSRTR